MKLKYILKRVLAIIPTFLGITILAYFLSTLSPGDPVDMIVGSAQLGVEDVERLRHQYGLDQPVFIQYIRWLGRMLGGNLGVSFRTSEPVASMILARLGPTLLITITSVVVSVILSVLMGVAAAVRPYSGWDYISSGVSFLAASAPNFFVCLLLVYIFGVRLNVLPTSGMYTTVSSKSVPDLIRHMIMPVTVLAFQQIGSLIRQVRGGMLEVLQEDYIRTAREKGLKERLVIVRHGLRNALIPVVTTVGMNLPFIVGGAVVTEQIFSWPGLGTLMVQSINGRDYPCIMGITVCIALVVLVGNLITDLIYGLLDPRISYQ